ncbi:glycoside hydrolase family 43 protein [Segetibacter sp. 3557_3]|uniref:glycoside hydrolase family 43 protein n=1 Tax=Segetibacter sp. 3557_3 TaxID=2547429 RepID=UPI001404B15B|nr:glycoside hydrolase family 43 protein [Segetibacter sp. 3557_3]
MNNSTPYTRFRAGSLQGLISMLAVIMTCSSVIAQKDSTGTTNPVTYDSFSPGALWYDTNGELINAHGGGIIYANKKYYWFGEKRGRSAQAGVNVYSSQDLYNWKPEGLALAANETDTTSDIARGCLMERPKVIYNEKTKKYLMWFHLELRRQGYSAARAGVAISDKPEGPYTFLKSFRPNGNMSRDMGLFVDDDGSAYHIYSSDENYALRLAKLTDDYTAPTTRDSLLFRNHREAPALFKYRNKYYLITSGCTGWTPNKATLHVANSLWGPWQLSAENPMKGPAAETTYGGQSTFVLPVRGKKDAFIFIADKWNPRDLKDSRYLWLPVQLDTETPYVNWLDKWELKFFNAAKK